MWRRNMWIIYRENDRMEEMKYMLLMKSNDMKCVIYENEVSSIMKW